MKLEKSDSSIFTIISIVGMALYLLKLTQCFTLFDSPYGYDYEYNQQMFRFSLISGLSWLWLTVIALGFSITTEKGNSSISAIGTFMVWASITFFIQAHLSQVTTVVRYGRSVFGFEEFFLTLAAGSLLIGGLAWYTVAEILEVLQRSQVFQEQIQEPVEHATAYPERSDHVRSGNA